MRVKKTQKIKISFPFGLYFHQLLCSNTDENCINPFKFWRKYEINHLETCWEFNIIHYLECCRQIEWQPAQKKKDTKVIQN